MKRSYRRSHAFLSNAEEISDPSSESSQFNQLCNGCLTVGIPLPQSDDIIRTRYWTVDQIQDATGLEDTIHFRKGSFRFASARSREAHFKSACDGCLLCQLLCFAHERLKENFEFNVDSAKWHIAKGRLETKPYYDVVNASFARSPHGERGVTPAGPSGGSLCWDLRFKGFTDSGMFSVQYTCNH